MSTAPALLLLLLIAGCVPAPQAAEGFVPVEASQVELRDGEEMKTAGALVFRGGIELRSPDPRFGGFSGLVVSADGARMLAITDKGYFLTARLIHDEAGRLTGIARADMGGLAGPDGQPVAGTSGHDSEALSAAGQDLIVGFEGPPRLWRYAGGVLTAPPRPLDAPDSAARLPSNRGFEAATVLADGRMLVLAEAASGGPAAWIGKPGQWQAVRYVRTGRFRPVDAASLPDGGAIVLERRFTWVGGLASRIVHVPASQLRGGGRIDGEELVVIDAPPLAENYEGLALRTTGAGETRIYLIADDNFHPLQRTLLLAFVWKRRLQ